MKKILPLLLLTLLIVLLGQLASTYGIFESNVAVGSEIELADWQILVNNINLNEEEQEFNITNILWDTNSNVLPGKAAPGLDGYFEIILDPRTTQVAIEYEVTFEFSELENSNIYITSVKDRNNNDILIVDSETYSSSMSLEEVQLNQIEIIKVSFTWELDEENSIIDSGTVNIPDSNLIIPVRLRVFQKI